VSVYERLARDDIAMLKQLVQDGLEIGSHSVTHEPAKMEMQPDVEADAGMC
jgi:hypothetical protein